MRKVLARGGGISDSTSVKEGWLMRLTKNDMARVVQQALCNLDELPAATHGEVQMIVRRHKVPRLHELYDDAVKILEKRVRCEYVQMPSDPVGEEKARRASSHGVPLYKPGAFRTTNTNPLAR